MSTEEQKAYSREYYRTHRAERLAYAAKRREIIVPPSRVRLGVTAEDIAAMRQAQKGRCAICLDDIAGQNEHLDHDHRTGKIRGLLCGTCNKGLGQFMDDPLVLQSALEYLKSHG